MARITTDERRINFICGEIGFKPDAEDFLKTKIV